MYIWNELHRGVEFFGFTIELDSSLLFFLINPAAITLETYSRVINSIEGGSKLS